MDANDLLIQQANNKKNSLQNSINDLNKKYESICSFYNVVQNSQSAMAHVNSVKNGTLSEVKLISKNNTVARNYYAGMKDVFSRVGAKIVTKAYGNLLFLLNVEKNKINSEISRCNYEISLIDHKLNQLEKEKREGTW